MERAFREIRPDFSQSDLDISAAIMDALKTINTNLEACLNLSVSSTVATTVSFPQQEIRERFAAMLEASKRLELWFVESSHKQRYPPNQSELESLRLEIASMEAHSKRKEQALSQALQQVGEWTLALQDLQERQATTMFELVPRTQELEQDVANPPQQDSMNTDEIWGQQAGDESVVEF